MIKFLKYTLPVIVVFSAIHVYGQSSTNSPYSQFGLGQLSSPVLPQNRAIGGIAAGLRKPSGYNNVNVANPASYSSIKLTTFDVGMFSGFTGLSKGNISENSFTASLNHLVFAVPVNKISALSFGILPFSTMGYRSSTSNKIDTVTTKRVSSGDGGISKAYIGYGVQIGKHLSVGANVSYLFGKLESNQDTEFPYDIVAFPTRLQDNKSVGGLSYDYGIQYFTPLTKKIKMTIGYSGTLSSKLNLSSTRVFTHYTKDATGAEDIALDTILFQQRASSKVTLPLDQRFGFVIERQDRWLIGADLTMGKWEDYREGSTDPGLKNTLGFAVGGELTPDYTSVTNYLKLVNYRLGFKYDKSYVNLNNTDIKQMALTFGFGFPLPSNRSTFYKINLGAELGKRGTLDNNLIKEKFANIYLGFTINDKWFQRYKFD